jgi:NAD+ kinase
MVLRSKISHSEIKRVLVVFKSSKLDRYRDDGSLFARKDVGDEDVSRVYERLTVAHDEHEASVAEIEGCIDSLGLEVVRATQPRKSDVTRSDLVVPIGGDGTFLWTARKVEGVPMLGVNSAPGASTGHYCGATSATFRNTLQAICSGELSASPLPRLKLEINGSRVPYLALNDAFFSHRCPAASSRYLLRVGPNHSLQVSSGVWLSTQSGSTGAINSAGGDLMKASDGRIQYLVNNPYRGDEIDPNLLHGYTSDTVKFVSRSPNNAVYLDGATLSYRLDFGSVLTVGLAEEKLMVYNYGRSKMP